jgi:hypothetical protein
MKTNEELNKIYNSAVFLGEPAEHVVKELVTYIMELQNQDPYAAQQKRFEESNDDKKPGDIRELVLALGDSIYNIGEEVEQSLIPYPYSVQALSVLRYECANALCRLGTSAKEADIQLEAKLKEIDQYYLNKPRPVGKPPELQTKLDQYQLDKQNQESQQDKPTQ